MSQKVTARLNATIILQNTTAYPFKLPRHEMVCLYCADGFDKPSIFRQHMETDHLQVEVDKIFYKMKETASLKVDCTALQCRRCKDSFTTLEDIAQHLYDVHDLTEINTLTHLGVIPFVFKNDRFDCAVCTFKFSNIRALSRHTQSHFLNVPCKLCGNVYGSEVSLLQHMRINHGTTRPTCKRCKLEFDFPEDLKTHLLESKACCSHKCSICREKFYSWSMKETHMEEVHGKKKSFPCVECETVFEKRDALRVHFVIEHTNDYHECSFCSKKFHTKPALQRHMISHTREKNYSCGVCGKAFFRKSTLNLHMWIHSDVKKYECEMCTKQFNQKIVWKKHIETYHPELLDETS